jgi:hypothetical protein
MVKNIDQILLLAYKSTVHILLFNPRFNNEKSTIKT